MLKHANKKEIERRATNVSSGAKFLKNVKYCILHAFFIKKDQILQKCLDSLIIIHMYKNMYIITYIQVTISCQILKFSSARLQNVFDVRS